MTGINKNVGKDKVKIAMEEAEPEQLRRGLDKAKRCQCRGPEISVKEEKQEEQIINKRLVTKT